MLGAVGGAAATPLVSLGIKNLNTFVQTLAVTAIDEGKVPGLAAMKPAGSVIKALNGAKGNLDRLGTYYAITWSSRRRSMNQRHHQELAQFILDQVTDRLFQHHNDLVVDTESITTLARARRLSRQARLSVRRHR